jgi:hypothetical protein
VEYQADRWGGNHWASIEIEPVDVTRFLPVLTYLSTLYEFPMPTIDWDVDGYGADFELLGSKAIIKVDTWSFSIAFEDDAVRDQVLTVLRALPTGYFQH